MADTTNNNNRIFGLDLLRGIAVLVVLFHHTMILEYKNNVIDFIGDLGGFIAVELFFILTGFLIGTTIIKLHNQEKTTSLKSIKTFLIRRWFRTLPSYYLVILIYFLLRLVEHWPPHFTAGQWLTQILFLQNAVSPEKGEFYAIAWSLCIQEWFYILFPLSLYLIQFQYANKKQSFIITTVIFLTLPLLIRFYLAYNSHLEFYAGYRQMVFLRLDSVAVGALFAFTKFYNGQFWNKHKVKFFSLGIFLVVALSVCYYYQFFVTYKNWHETVDSGVFLKTIFFPLFSAGIALTLPYMFALKINQANRIVTVLTFISVISYSMYLIHPIIINVVYNLKTILITNYTRIAAIWIFTIIGAYFLYHFFEKRITDLRKKFGSRKYAVSAFNSPLKK